MASDRRALFREYIRSFTPVGDPLQTLVQGAYVAHPLATSSRIANRLDIEPASSHLVVGGIGSGKTTELLRAKALLAGDSDVRTVFWDVPAVQKVSALHEGVLIALAFRGIVQTLQMDEELHHSSYVDFFSTAVREGNKLVDGYWDEPERPEDYDEMVHVRGILSPPDLNTTIDRLVGILQEIVVKSNRKFAIFFDGLDRVRNSVEFGKMVLQDVSTLSSIGIGVVVVGPQEIRFDLHRHIVERFTAFYLHGAADVFDNAGLTFLDEILKKRAPESILPPESRVCLANWSGGGLRDLITLARDVGEVAYGSGDESISKNHVDLAADRFGRNLLLGITPAMAKHLLGISPILRTKLNPGKPNINFVAATELDIALLLHRLVIEIPDTPVRYLIHPCVKPHLNALRTSVH